MVRILVAEDDAHIAKLVQFKLSRDGYSVQIAKNGQEAVDLLDVSDWSMIVLDVMMPILNGWEVLRQLRSRPQLAKLPVLILTAKGHDQERANAAELGATHFLQKPFDPDELSKTVKEMIKSAGAPTGKQ